jgi:tRNA A37 methylthiotransferase MiaB
MGITRERYKVLSEEASKTAMEYRSSFRGKELTVLTEKKDREGIPEGWSGNYLRVKIQSSETNLNELVPARVTSVGRNGILNAEPVNRVT